MSTKTKIIDIKTKSNNILLITAQQYGWELILRDDEKNPRNPDYQYFAITHPQELAEFLGITVVYHQNSRIEIKLSFNENDQTDIDKNVIMPILGEETYGYPSFEFYLSDRETISLFMKVLHDSLFFLKQKYFPTESTKEIISRTFEDKIIRLFQEIAIDNSLELIETLNTTNYKKENNYIQNIHYSIQRFNSLNFLGSLEMMFTSMSFDNLLCKKLVNSVIIDIIPKDEYDELFLENFIKNEIKDDSIRLRSVIWLENNNTNYDSFLYLYETWIKYLRKKDSWEETMDDWVDKNYSNQS